MSNPDNSNAPKVNKNNVPSWVDEVLGTEAKPATQPTDLRIPEPALVQQPAPNLNKTPDTNWASSPTGSQTQNPSIFRGPAIISPAAPSPFDMVQDNARQAYTQFGDSVATVDVSQKKLIAGLLAIFLGSLGVHKFYLGMNNPGLILLGANVGVWILAFVLGIITLGFGLFVTLPLAGFVSSLLGLLGLVEGIIYLTKTDAVFEQEYIIDKKPWL